MSDAPKPRAKASGILTFIDILREMLDAETLERVIAGMPEDAQRLFTHPPLSTSWVDDAQIAAVMRALSGVMSKAQFKELGRRQMERDMTTTYKVLVRLATPKTIVKRAPLIWSTYTENGTMSAEITGEREALVRLDGVVNRSETFWAYQHGTISRVFEFTRAKQVEIELVEGGGELGYGVFRLTWA